MQATSLGELDLAALTIEAGKGSDRDAQAEIVNQLALAYNELLPQIPLWERYGNNPTLEDVRVRMAGGRRSDHQQRHVC